MNISFQVYVSGSELVVVGFPEDGGESIYELRKPLDSLGLQSVGGPVERLSLPHGTYAMKQNNLDKGQLYCEIVYERELVFCWFLSHRSHKSDVEKDTTVLDKPNGHTNPIVYTFDQLNVEYSPNSEIQKQKSKARVTAVYDA